MPIRIQSATLPYRTAASLILLIGCGDVGSSNANGTLPDGAAVLRFGDGGGRLRDGTTSTSKLDGSKGGPHRDGSAAGFGDGAFEGGDDGSFSGREGGRVEGGAGPQPGSDASQPSDGSRQGSDAAGSGPVDAGESLDAMLVIPDSGWPVRRGDAGSSHADGGSGAHGDGGSGHTDGGATGHVDGSSTGQADGGAPPPATYCSRFPGALWCLDFDESLDLNSVGPYATLTNGGSLAIVPSVPDSPPNSLLASFTRTDASTEEVAMLVRTFPLPSGSGLTVQVDVNVPAVWNSASFPSVLQLYSGTVLMTASISYEQNGPVYVSWSPYVNYQGFSNVYIPAGSYHTITATIENGRIYALVDGVLAGSLAESGLGPEVTVQLGLFGQGGHFASSSSINFDNLVVVAR